MRFKNYNNRRIFDHEGNRIGFISNSAEIRGLKDNVKVGIPHMICDDAYVEAGEIGNNTYIGRKTLIRNIIRIGNNSFISDGVVIGNDIIKLQRHTIGVSTEDVYIRNYIHEAKIFIEKVYFQGEKLGDGWNEMKFL